MPDVTGAGRSFAEAFRNALAAANLGRASFGKPRPSYQAKGWLAQYRHLSRTRQGREALTGAGVSPTRRTIRAWERGQRQASKANRDAIARAYEAMRHGGIPEWVKHANMEVTGRINVAGDVRDRGAGTAATFLVDLDKANGPSPEQPSKSGWDVVDEGIEAGLDDDNLEELIAEEIITADIDTTDQYAFPGGGPVGGYTVKISSK